MKVTQDPVVAALRHERQRQDMTQLQLASRAGIYRQWVSQFETGRRLPSLDIVHRIADVLGVTVRAIDREGTVLK